ncbi:MAG TPA: hypothetical protein VIN57_06915 [Magnetovibrio sp.]
MPMSSSCCPPAAGGRLFTILAVVGLVFGVATVFSGGKVLFGDDAARTAVGAYVPFVVWSNFIAGFTYIIAAIGLLRRLPWATWLALGIVALTAVTFVGLGVHIVNGGAYETRTVAAMTLRLGVWLMIASAAWRVLYRK